MAKLKLHLDDLAGYRKRSGLNQSAFWKELGVTQSGGSRYENGRNLPKPVALLLALRETGNISSPDLAAAAAMIAKAKAAKAK